MPMAILNSLSPLCYQLALCILKVNFFILHAKYHLMIVRNFINCVAKYHSNVYWCLIVILYKNSSFARRNLIKTFFSVNKLMRHILSLHGGPFIDVLQYCMQLMKNKFNRLTVPQWYNVQTSVFINDVHLKLCDFDSLLSNDEVWFSFGHGIWLINLN